MLSAVMDSMTTSSGIFYDPDDDPTLYTSFPASVSTGQPSSSFGPDDAMQNFNRMRRVVNDVILPVIFSLGIIGNVLNAVLLFRSRECISSSSSSKKKSGKRKRSDGGTMGHDGSRGPTVFERSAAIGLIALTSSDLAFCLVGFGRVLFTSTPADWRIWTIVGVYVSAYRGALLNLFLFTSTWMIVLVSVERYMAVCHPFRAGAMIRVRRTIAAHCVVAAVSVAVNVPLFLRNTVSTSCSPPNRLRPLNFLSLTTTPTDTLSETPYSVSTPNITQSNVDAAAILYADDVVFGSTDYRSTPSSSCDEFYFVATSELSKAHPVVIYMHRLIWFALGTFVPLLLIAYSNVRLILEVCAIRRHALSADGSSTNGQSKTSGARTTATTKRASSLGSARSNSTAAAAAGNSDRAVTLRLTMTLIAIVVCFVVLVCPSMFVQFAWFAVGGVPALPASSGGGNITSSSNVTGIVVRPTSPPASSQIPFQTAMIVTDLMQAVKFSSNFLLYCVVSRSFRRTFARLVQIQKCRQRCSSSRSRGAVPPMMADCDGDRIGMSLMKSNQKEQEAGRIVKESHVVLVNS